MKRARHHPKRWWVRMASWTTAAVVGIGVGIWVAVLVFAPPTRAHLVALVQDGDSSIDATRAGCIVDTMRQTLTAARTAQILAGVGHGATAGEQDAAVTAAVTCSGAGDVDLRGGVDRPGAGAAGG